MKKRIIIFILALTFVFACVLPVLGATANTPAAPNNEVRGVWISFLEMQTILTGKTERQFKNSIELAFSNIVDLELNTVYVQVRPYSDALYKSSYFPWSHLITGTEGMSPSFDPLEIMVNEAHARGLKIEAWLNPYRVRPTGNTKPLAESSPAKKWLDAGDRSVIKNGDMIIYNPASTKAQNLIVNGAKEIVQNYKVDGIHIDDYFYPDTSTDFDKTFDTVDYKAYTNAGGKLSHSAWRRQNVESLVKKMYGAIKEVNANVKFGISPQSNIDKNYSTHFIDVKKMATTAGYCDYIAPQIYFGFQHKTMPYAATWDSWAALVDDSIVDIYVGIASYKVGKVDSYAGNGKNEWINNSNLTAEMIKYARSKDGYDGFVLYRYDYIFSPVSGLKSHVSKENANLKKIL